VIQGTSPGQASEMGLITMEDVSDGVPTRLKELIAILGDFIPRELFVREHAEIGVSLPQFFPRFVGTEHQNTTADPSIDRNGDLLKTVAPATP